MRLYEVTYFAFHVCGDELFCKGRSFSDKEKAMACLQGYTNEFAETLNAYLYPERVNLYTRMRVSEETDGEFKYLTSRTFSYSESDSDEDREKRHVVLNTNPEFFKTI